MSLHLNESKIQKLAEYKMKLYGITLNEVMKLAMVEARWDEENIKKMNEKKG